MIRINTKHCSVVVTVIVLSLGIFSSCTHALVIRPATVRIVVPVEISRTNVIDFSHGSRFSRSCMFSSTLEDEVLPSPSSSSVHSLISSLRGVLRSTTGLSLTATRAACRAATGISISTVFAKVLSIFPLVLRFFIQPFLILYYTPFVLLRAIVGPSKEFKENQRAAHDMLVKGWKNAVQAAEKANEDGYWPVRVDGK